MPNGKGGKLLMRLYIPHAMRAVSVGFAYFVAQRYPHSHLHLPFAICHVACAMRLPPFAIPPLQAAAAAMGCGTFAFITLFGFVWLCCLRLCHFCRSCSRRRRHHLNSSASAFYLHLSTFCACYSFIGFDVSLAASKQKLKV